MICLMFDSLYSCLVVMAQDDLTSWRLFEYGVGGPVPGIDRCATRAHTNLLRPGAHGRPAGRGITILRWRASTSLRPYDAVLDWAAATAVVFRYNAEVVQTSPLLDILMAPQPVVDRGMLDGRLLREHVSFSVDVDCDPVDARRFRTWLVDAMPSAHLTCWIWLEGVMQRGPH